MKQQAGKAVVCMRSPVQAGGVVLKPLLRVEVGGGHHLGEVYQGDCLILTHLQSTGSRLQRLSV